MSKQTWTAVVSALLFVVLAAVVAVVPVPYVAYSPGNTYDMLGRSGDDDVVSVKGIDTFNTSGSLRMTTVSVTRADATISLPEALYSYLRPDREILPRWAIYPAGTSAGELRTQEARAMDTSQSDAVVAALKLAGHKVVQRPMVVAVSPTGPAVGKLLPGDLIIRVNGTPTPTELTVRQLVSQRRIGELVTFTILRDRLQQEVRVATVASKSSSPVPVIGVSIGVGYTYDPEVTLNIDEGVGGSSAGLVMALAVYDKITPGELTGGQIVAGTGEIDGSGKVSRVGGVREKIAAAEVAGASYFVLPEANCADVETPAKMRLVAVNSLAESVGALEALRQAKHDQVKGCS